MGTSIQGSLSNVKQMRKNCPTIQLSIYMYTPKQVTHVPVESFLIHFLLIKSFNLHVLYYKNNFNCNKVIQLLNVVKMNEKKCLQFKYVY